MSVVIKTKSGTGVPSSLATGELGVDTTAGKLYVGSASGSVLTINPTQIAAGTLDSQSLYWDNTAAQWLANSNILLASSGTLTATGGIINSTIGATGPSTGAFTDLTTTGTLTATGGIINSAIGATGPSTGAFTNLTTTGTLTVGTTLTATGGITGSTVGASSPATGAFTTLEASGNTTVGTITSTSGNAQFHGPLGTTSNIVIGTGLQNANTNAIYTTCVGVGAGNGITAGAFNTFIGHNAGNGITTGAFNTFIGIGAGGVISSNPNGCVVLGSGTSALSTIADNTFLVATGLNPAQSRIQIDDDGARINANLRIGKFGFVPTIYDPRSSLPANNSGQVDGELVIARDNNFLYIAVWNAGDSDWKTELLS